MDKKPNKLFDKIHPFSQATLSSIKYLVENNVPESELRNFMLWLVDSENPYCDEYLQLSGINKMVELADFMLRKSYTNKQTQKITDAVGVLNAYFVFEVVSDNLAIGLSSSHNLNSDSKIRKDSLIKFNNVMQAQLKENTFSGNNVLEPLKNQLSKISVYQQSLSPLKMKYFADKYLLQHPNSSLHDLEFSLHDYLILNIASCLEVVNAMNNHIFLPHLTKSLVERYKAVNKLLSLKNRANLLLLANEGKKTILVKPTLLFLIALLEESNQQFINDSVARKLLMNTLDNSALLIRLQNDIGSKLLELSDKTINQIFNNFSENIDAVDDRQLLSPLNYLLSLIEMDKYSSYFFRIHKDISYAEFNICLQNLHDLDNRTAVTQQFFDNLFFFRRLYKSRKKSLMRDLAKLNHGAKDNIIGKLIWAMVEFHEKLYEKNYDKNGEYAID